MAKGIAATPEVMETAFLLHSRGLTDKEISGVIGLSYDWCNDFSKIVRLVEKTRTLSN